MPDSRRLFERISDFHNALTRLSDVLERPEDDIVRDSIIQRFEFTFELAWKALKLWLEFRSAPTLGGPRDVLREALQHGLIDNGNAWSRLQSERNKTSHTYDEKKAVEVASFVRAEGLALFQQLDAKFTEITKDVAP